MWIQITADFLSATKYHTLYLAAYLSGGNFGLIDGTASIPVARPASASLDLAQSPTPIFDTDPTISHPMLIL